MIKYIKPQWIIHLFVLFFYILSYINAVYYKETVFYWNVNVALYAIVFYHLGFMYKKYQNEIKRFKIAIVSVSGISIGSLLYFVMNKRFEYHLDLKYQTYQQFGLDILIPLSLIVLLIFISHILANSKAITNILSPVGESSLTIMYMHVSILIVFPLHITNYYLVVLLAILLPFVFHQHFLKHIKFTSLLFLGRK